MVGPTDYQGSLTWRYLTAAYILGGRLHSTSFKNAIMNKSTIELAKDQNIMPLCSTIRWTFESTPPKSLLRKFLVDTIYWRSRRPLLAANMCDAQHLDFVTMLGRQLAEQGNVTAEDVEMFPKIDKARITQDKCCGTYHEHD